MGRYVFKRFLPNLRGGYVNLFQELPALLSKMLRRMFPVECTKTARDVIG